MMFKNTNNADYNSSGGNGSAGRKNYNNASQHPQQMPHNYPQQNAPGGPSSPHHQNVYTGLQQGQQQSAQTHHNYSNNYLNNPSADNTATNSNQVFHQGTTFDAPSSSSGLKNITNVRPLGNNLFIGQTGLGAQRVMTIKPGTSNKLFDPSTTQIKKSEQQVSAMVPEKVMNDFYKKSYLNQDTSEEVAKMEAAGASKEQINVVQAGSTIRGMEAEKDSEGGAIQSRLVDKGIDGFIAYSGRSGNMGKLGIMTNFKRTEQAISDGTLNPTKEEMKVFNQGKKAYEALLKPSGDPKKDYLNNALKEEIDTQSTMAKTRKKAIQKIKKPTANTGRRG